MLHIPIEEFSTPSPMVADVSESILSVSALMKECEVRHVPIVEDGKVVGIVSERNINAVINVEGGGNVSVGQIMVRDPYTVMWNEPLETVAFNMSKRKIGSAIVVNETLTPVGIFTSTDALNALIEVIRGDMKDYDE